jgi:hypothetical protein
MTRKLSTTAAARARRQRELFAKIRAACYRNKGSIFSPAARPLAVIRDMVRAGELTPTDDYRRVPGAPLMRRYELAVVP